MGLTEKQTVKELMIKYGFAAPDMTVTEFAEDILPSAQPEQAVKDCRNCKHGKYNDYHDTYFCYNAEDCSNLDKWETSAQPEQQWIPCSERLPEDGDTVLVQFDDGDMEILTFPNIYKRLNRVAWLPLPEPYKERREE